tara:strand:+ start:165 stop:671 length:507 start_codon:yes stop_codon:yes gene_type:complete
MIYLIGFMGAGKTTIGQQFALENNLTFIDTDKEIETRNNRKILDIFQKEGQDYFRELEKELLISLSENKVVACGGGLPIYNNNMSFIKKSGISIYLKVSVEELLNRLLNNSNNRPLIKYRSNNNLRNFIQEEIKKREKFYSMANYTINTSKLSQEDILRKINSLIFSI